MKKIIIVEQDTIVSNGLLKTMEDFSGEKIRIDVFSSMDDFNKKYFESDTSTLDDSEIVTESTKSFLSEKEIHKDVDLLIIASEFLGESAASGIEFLLNKFRENKFSKKKNPTQLMVLGYYYEDLHLKHYEHHGVVDFLFKPVDAQLFLQKLEIAFNLGKKVETSYLAKANIEEPISIGKLGKIEELSEFGLAIRNPRPIKPGQFARFYSKVFFCAESPSLLARCYMNTPHPEAPNEFLSYFSYFGIRREQLLNIRKEMHKDTKLEKSHIHSDAIHAMELVDNSKVKKDIVVIDNDPTSLGFIKEVYEGAFKNVEVHGFNSYTSFVQQVLNAQSQKNPLDEFNKLHRLGIYSQMDQEVEKKTKKKKKKKKKEEEGEGPKLSERYRAVPVEDKLVIEFDKEEKQLFRVSMESGKAYNCFGYTFEKLKEEKELWRSFIHEYSVEEFDEFLEISIAGQQGRMDFWGISEDTSPARIRIEAQNKPNSIQFTISDITHIYKPDKKNAGKGTFKKIYAIYLDGGMIRSDDKNQFLSNLKNMIKKAGLKPNRRKIKVNILGLEDGETRSSNYELDEVDDFFYRPLDRSLIMQKMMLYIFPFEEEISQNHLEYFSNSHDVVLSTYVGMKEVSEHGIAIQYKIPFKEGTFMRFISKIFYLDNGDPLIGRCYFSEKMKDGDEYISYFEFFGVTDEVFKRIRVWIRESYVESKQAS